MRTVTNAIFSVPEPGISPQRMLRGEWGAHRQLRVLLPLVTVTICCSSHYRYVFRRRVCEMQDSKVTLAPEWINICLFSHRNMICWNAFP